MNPHLLPVWTVIEEQRYTVTEFVTALAAEQLQLRRSPHAWSIAQIVEHITRSEAATLTHSKQKQRARARPMRFDTRLRYALMNIHFALPVVKVRAPVPAIVPSENPSAQDVCRNWEAVRKDWFDYLKDLRDEEFRLGIFFHPLVGPLTPKMTLEFLKMHGHHHFRQIRMTLKINRQVRPA